MSNVTSTVTHVIEVQQGTDIVRLALAQSNKSTVIRGTLTGNGAAHSAAIPSKGTKDPHSVFIQTEAKALANMFDPTFAQANAIDSDWLIKRLLAQLEVASSSAEEREAMEGRIKNLVVVSNLMGLHAVGADVMNRLYGFNWVVEEAPNLIMQSQKWKELIERIEVAQEGLKEALSS